MRDIVHTTIRVGVALIIYAIAFVLPFSFEKSDELMQHLPESVQARLETIVHRYHSIMAGPRGVRARFTALVTLNESSIPILQGNYCKRREAVANLIQILSDAGVGAIAIDFAFSRDQVCPSDSTERLINSLNAASARFPVTIAQHSQSVDQMNPDDLEFAQRAGMKRADLKLVPVIDSRAHIGLDRVDKNIERIPLGWQSFDSAGQRLTSVGFRRSLPFETAQLVRDAFPDGEAYLRDLLNNGLHPVTTLIRMDDFIRIDGSVLLCGTSFLPQSAGSCAIQADALRKLRGRVAVIGATDNPDDMFQTAVGSMPGVALQANYIESLLDSRFFKTIPLRWLVAGSLVWFALIEVPFLLWPHNSEKAFLTSLLIMAAVAFVAYYVLVVNLGMFLELWTPSVSALILRYWYQWFEKRQGADRH